MAQIEDLVVRIEVDASGFVRAIRRASYSAYKLTRWRRQPSDPNPFSRISLREGPPMTITAAVTRAVVDPHAEAGVASSSGAAGTQVPGGNPLTVQLRDGAVCRGQQVPGGNPAASPSDEA